MFFGFQILVALYVSLEELDSLFIQDFSKPVIKCKWKHSVTKAYDTYITERTETKTNQSVQGSVAKMPYEEI